MVTQLEGERRDAFVPLSAGAWSRIVRLAPCASHRRERR